MLRHYRQFCICSPHKHPKKENIWVVGGTLIELKAKYLLKFSEILYSEVNYNLGKYHLSFIMLRRIHEHV